jgi:hypothetical protein
MQRQQSTTVVDLEVLISISIALPFRHRELSHLEKVGGGRGFKSHPLPSSLRLRNSSSSGALIGVLMSFGICFSSS